MKGIRNAYSAVGKIGRNEAQQTAMRTADKVRRFGRTSSIDNLQRSGRRRMAVGTGAIGLMASPGSSSGSRGRSRGRSSGSMGLR